MYTSIPGDLALSRQRAAPAVIGFHVRDACRVLVECATYRDVAQREAGVAVLIGAVGHGDCAFEGGARHRAGRAQVSIEHATQRLAIGTEQSPELFGAAMQFDLRCHRRIGGQ